jgi:hypothetical protein
MGPKGLDRMVEKTEKPSRWTRFLHAVADLPIGCCAGPESLVITLVVGGAAVYGLVEFFN